MSVIQKLQRKGLIKPPTFVSGSTMYETIMGSQSYGVSTDSSDIDVYGFCIPPKDMVFPHLRGEIPGFGYQTQRFEQFQQHHIMDASTGKEYDVSIYSIIKYFQLLMDNNPNIIDSLFTPRVCVIHSTKMAEHIRDNRKMFLHKGAWHRFKGYAYAQMAKTKSKQTDPKSKRYESVQKFGYDVKFAYHVVRLLNEIEMIMTEHDLDLQRNNDQLKAIRAGEWTLPQLEQYFFDKEKSLEAVYTASTLPYKADEQAVKALLLQSLEEHYGSLDGAIESADHYKELLRQIQKITEKI